jgi:hypothetical protein
MSLILLNVPGTPETIGQQRALTRAAHPASTGRIHPVLSVNLAQHAQACARESISLSGGQPFPRQDLRVVPSAFCGRGRARHPKMVPGRLPGRRPVQERERGASVREPRWWRSYLAEAPRRACAHVRGLQRPDEHEQSSPTARRPRRTTTGAGRLSIRSLKGSRPRSAEMPWRQPLGKRASRISGACTTVSLRAPQAAHGRPCPSIRERPLSCSQTVLLTRINAIACT